MNNPTKYHVMNEDFELLNVSENLQDAINYAIRNMCRKWTNIFEQDTEKIVFGIKMAGRERKIIYNKNMKDEVDECLKIAEKEEE